MRLSSSAGSVFATTAIVITSLLSFSSVTLTLVDARDLTNEECGDRDRFWRHHVTTETLMHEGVNYYPKIKHCLEDKLTPDEQQQIQTTTNIGKRRPGHMEFDPVHKNAMMVVVENAISPIHAKAVQTLAQCVRTNLPHLYESRAMYQEMNLDEDDGLGGNCPTHLAPLVSIFLPKVVEEMQRTLETAYNAPNSQWPRLVGQDQKDPTLVRELRMFAPEHVGMRASEHLTYSDFPRLAEHDDGHTVYTMNFAFVGPDEYDGGEFFILTKNIDGSEYRKHIKPPKFGALVFLGGQYLHGVEEIFGGHREMYSTEFWPYPDTPFGSNLWSNYPKNMEDYIEICNEEQRQKGGKDYKGPCTAEFSKSTPFLDDREIVKQKYSSSDGDEEDDEEEEGNMADEDNDGFYVHPKMYEQMSEQQKKAANPFYPEDPPSVPGVDRAKADKQRPNRVRPSSLKPVNVILEDKDGNTVTLNDFKPREEEPDFLIPKTLKPGEMQPIRWREDLTPVDGPDGESFVIGFPPELHEEFVKYIKEDGMMDVAKSILYEEEALEPGEQRIYTLNDGEKWTAMVQGNWNTDMVWLDPGDESCFESLLGVLRRGNFDIVLEQVGKAFDLDGLMVQGVGAIFLTEYEETENIHVDIEGSRGSFYNVIVPVHIPIGEDAIFKISDQGDEYMGRLALDPQVGVVLGGESRHGTGECDYRKKKDFRLSFAVYVADINESNVDLIASDSTSLWPTEGDTFWFQAQKGRLWTKDGKNSIKNDKGRFSVNIQDKSEKCATMDKKLCETDLQGMRLECPKTCELYLEDDVYYAKYFQGINPAAAASAPSQCIEDSTHPTCKVE
mmetsp:Transcript_26645/g.63514  ORF Transcript_26645/g.63514 Transcript_26645/m.63514 type:complete len:838 (-) Transcript_26645:227-2740(-)